MSEYHHFSGGAERFLFQLSSDGFTFLRYKKAGKFAGCEGAFMANSGGIAISFVLLTEFFYCNEDLCI